MALPESHSDWREEYAAFHEGAALCDLGSWNKFLFAGPDRRKFLNGLLTNDVLKLPAMTGFEACLLTPKGKLQADFELFDVGDELLALCRPEGAGNLWAAISKVILLSETKMEDATGRYGLLYLAGPKAGAALESALGAIPALKPYQAHAARWRNAPLLLMSYPRLRPGGFLLLPRAEDSPGLAEALLNTGEALGLKRSGPRALETVRVESGVPLFGADMDEDTIPLEAGLDAAISFTKGCYMGQETISRIHHLGHVNRILVSLKLASRDTPAKGSPVFSGEKEVGKVTSAAWSPRMRAPIALAMVRTGSSRPGTALKVGGSSGADAEVHAPRTAVG